jgi:hypothetical protein
MKKSDLMRDLLNSISSVEEKKNTEEIDIEYKKTIDQIEPEKEILSDFNNFVNIIRKKIIKKRD